MEERTCKNCGCFIDGNLKKIFCSTKCKSDFSNKTQALKRESKQERECCVCGSMFIPPNYKSNTCSTECRERRAKDVRDAANKMKAEKHIKESIEKFKDADPYTYTECKLCGMRSGHLGYHIKKIHGILIDDYKKTYNSEICSQQYSDNHSGEKNPAYNHGGKYSPFSKNFIKYDGLSESDKETEILETFATASKTREENPDRNPTRIEYYLNKGMSLADAEEALSERQTTFSLEKCIERYGDEEGLNVWKTRQEKWQTTLNSKTDEEKAEINKKKATIMNYGLIGNGAYSNIDGLLYIIKLPNSFLKFGITSREIDKRYTKLQMSGCEVLYEMRGDLETIAKIEVLLKSKYSDKIITKDQQHGIFGYSETVNGLDVFDIVDYIESLTKETIEEEYLCLAKNRNW